MAQPGEPDRATADAGSGISRVSPAGPSMPGAEVRLSFTRKTENAVDRPTPNLETSSKRRSGITLTRVTPSGPTTASATCPTPAAASLRATEATVGAAARGRAARPAADLGRVEDAARRL